ncbi:ABC transporter substrate-binding protein [Uniformispora flossi]|uniref:ABC transporter substrate-binding protein n=1 Tax=Uniformispora flossi TaxID=3390723 RepID=UPI003C2E3725
MTKPASRRARRPLRAAAALSAVAVLAAAGCTVESKDSGTAAPGAGPAQSTAAPGLTSDTIKLGIAYPDLDAVKAFVNIDNGNYETAFRAVVDNINAGGGIGGRKIEPVFAKVNLLSPAAQQETCVKLTQDAKVFAVLFAMPYDATCYVQTNRTAAIGTPLTKEQYAQAQAPAFAYTSAEAAAEAVRALAAHGDFAGRKVAVAAITTDQAQVDQQVTPALQVAGITPVVTGYIPANATDPAAFAQQTNVLFQKAQASGADTLLIVGGAAHSLPQALEKASWRPRLMFTTVPSSYLGAKGQHDFSILKDAVAAEPLTTWQDDQELMSCAAALGVADPSLNLKLLDPRTVPAGQPNPGASLQIACQTLTLFKAIAGRAGKDLNYASFQQAGQTLGGLHIPGYLDPANYTPQTPNGAIPVAVVGYDPAGNRFGRATN